MQGFAANYCIYKNKDAFGKRKERKINKKRGNGVEAAGSPRLLLNWI